MLSARELNSESLPNRNWINERLTFTHGYGVTLGPVNQVTPEGLPVLFIKDLPPQSDGRSEGRRAGIYFGELSNDHVFVKTDDARSSTTRAATTTSSRTYAGNGGVPLVERVPAAAVRHPLPLDRQVLLSRTSPTRAA